MPADTQRRKIARRKQGLFVSPAVIPITLTGMRHVMCMHRRQRMSLVNYGETLRWQRLRTVNQSTKRGAFRVNSSSNIVGTVCPGVAEDSSFCGQSSTLTIIGMGTLHFVGSLLLRVVTACTATCMGTLHFVGSLLPSVSRGGRGDRMGTLHFVGSLLRDALRIRYGDSSFCGQSSTV